jgi:hypothetical protein
MKPWPYSLAAVIAFSFCFVSTPAGGEKAAFSVSIEDFAKLSPADQKLLLGAAFDHRLQHATNIRYESQESHGDYKNWDGRSGELVDEVSEFTFRDWRLGRAYRIIKDSVGPDPSEPMRPVEVRFDHDTGIRKSKTTMDENVVIGMIDKGEDKWLEGNRFGFWLDGKNPSSTGEFLFRYLSEHKDTYTIEAPYDIDKVRLTLPWIPFTFTNARRPLVGKREYVLDSVKGFFPVRGTARWDATLKDGSEVWQTEEFTVEAARQIKDIWMPIELKEIRGSALLPAKFVNVLVTEVEKIELDTVTAKDLELVFPKGTQVLDRVQRMQYVVGENGEQTHVYRDSEARGDPSPRGLSRRTAIIIFVLAAAGVG